MRKIGAAACILVFAACGVDEPALEATAPPAVLSPSPTAVIEEAVCEPAESGNKDIRMFLTDVAVTPRDGTDRVVFSFEPPEGEEADVPYYKIEPATPPLREDPSDRELDVEGDTFVEIVMWASGVDLGAEGARETYTGPNEFQPEDTQLLVELQEGGDFENVLTWYAGLDQDGCWEATSLTDPVRIAVDLAPV